MRKQTPKEATEMLIARKGPSRSINKKTVYRNGFEKDKQKAELGRAETQQVTGVFPSLEELKERVDGGIHLKFVA